MKHKCPEGVDPAEFEFRLMQAQLALVPFQDRKLTPVLANEIEAMLREIELSTREIELLRVAEELDYRPNE